MRGIDADPWVREPAVAGRFYNDDPNRLRIAVRRHLATVGTGPADTATVPREPALGGPQHRRDGSDGAVDPRSTDAPPPTVGGATETAASAGGPASVRDAVDRSGAPPVALIAPHAGYRYSGATAGAGWARLASRRTTAPRRIVLLGPSHRVPVEGPGVGVSTASAWRTPLGDVPVDAEATATLVGEGLAAVADDAHAGEHSLEVHLPFLLEAFGPIPVVPLVTGGCGPAAAAAAVQRLWDGDDAAVVVSSDLSHYLSEPEARRRDDRTLAAVVEGRVDDIGPDDACGRTAIGAVLLAARSHGVAPSLLAVSTSADTAGQRDRVVGYASVAFEVPPPLDDAERGWLVRRARLAIEHEAVTGEPDPARDDDVPSRLRLLGAAFVTLRRRGQLLGCIGSLDAARPLWRDVVHNARAAAFEDPRFPPLGPDELAGLELTVSVLSAPEAVDGDRDEITAALRPGIDGVILESGSSRGTFLPSVWTTLPAPDSFLTALTAKAGLGEGAWPSDLRVWRYTTDEFAD